MTGRAVILRGDALHLPLPDESVDLIVTSPPYFALRSYQDEGAHYEGQVGSEPTPQEFLEALWAATEEMVRVLKPSGSIFINLGDKYAGSGGHNNAGLAGGPSQLQGRSQRATDFKGGGGAKRRAEQRNAARRNAPDAYNKATVGGARAKSLMGLPWRYAIGCIDQLGLILRAELVWSKLNGLPESVTDRVRRSHEQWFHFTREPRYFAAIDEIRQEHSASSVQRAQPHRAQPGKAMREGRPLEGTANVKHTFALDQMTNPLGKLPGSVWSIATEPLKVPDYFVRDETGERFVWAGQPKKAKRASADDSLFEVDAAEPGTYPGLVALWHYAAQRHRAGCEFLYLFAYDHFAAFPTEWPRQLILGWAPLQGICSACGEGRRPVAQKSYSGKHEDTATWVETRTAERGWGDRQFQRDQQSTIVGYACSCTPYVDHPAVRSTGPTHAQAVADGGYAYPQYADRPRSGKWREYKFDEWDAPAVEPAVVLDPFGGTGTTAMVAKALGAIGISVDLSSDYTKLARWRCEQSGHGAKAQSRTWSERQEAML